jgi:hypothetical protein
VYLRDIEQGEPDEKEEARAHEASNPDVRPNDPPAGHRPALRREESCAPEYISIP